MAQSAFPVAANRLYAAPLSLQALMSHQSALYVVHTLEMHRCASSEAGMANTAPR